MSVRVWHVNKGEIAGPELRHAEVVNEAVFSPDGRYVLTTCEDGTVRMWDYRTAAEIVPALRQGVEIRYVAFTPTGDKVLTWAGRVVRLWDVTEREELQPPTVRSEPGVVVFSPDGKRVLRATETAVRVYDTQTNQPVGGTLPHKDKVSAAAFSADGKRLLTVCHVPNGDQQEGHVRVWETATGELLGQPLVHPRSVLEASFSRDGRRVLTACQDGKARLWDVAKNAQVGESTEHKDDLSRALFLPDGKHFLTVDAVGGLRLWDAATAEAVGPTWGHRQPIQHLAFSSDGQQLATASGRYAVRLGSEHRAQNCHYARAGRADPAGLRSVRTATASSPSSADRQVRVWETDNGKPAGPTLRHCAAVSLAAFSDDGKRIVTVAADGACASGRRRAASCSARPHLLPLGRGNDRPSTVFPSVETAGSSWRLACRAILRHAGFAIFGRTNGPRRTWFAWPRW